MFVLLEDALHIENTLTLILRGRATFGPIKSAYIRNKGALRGLLEIADPGLHGTSDESFKFRDRVDRPISEVIDIALGQVGADVCNCLHTIERSTKATHTFQGLCSSPTAYRYTIAALTIDFFGTLKALSVRHALV